MRRSGRGRLGLRDGAAVEILVIDLPGGFSLVKATKKKKSARPAGH
jgi:hypothetical protein